MTLPEQSDFPMADIEDVGSIPSPPGRIALCSEHGWWFPVDRFDPAERCPSSGCAATVHYYLHRGHYTPESCS